MDFVHPSFAFVLVDGLIAPRLFASLYRDYAGTIELEGSEDLLEFGCGSGGIAERLAPRLTTGSLTCVDISPPMVRIATRRMAKHDHVKCLTGRIEDLALAGASYDVVVIHNALHDVTEDERASTVETLASLLRPGGRLYFREPTVQPHGLPTGEYHTLMQGAGLREVRSREGRRFPMGPFLEAVFERPG